MEGFLEGAGSAAGALSLGVARAPVMPSLAAGASFGAAVACTADCSCGSPASGTAVVHAAASLSARRAVPLLYEHWLLYLNVHKVQLLFSIRDLIRI